MSGLGNTQHTPNYFQLTPAMHQIMNLCLSNRPTRTVHHHYSPHPKRQGQGHSSVQRQPSGFTYELRDEDQAEAYVVIAVVGVVVVAVRRPAVLRVVVPTPAAQNTIRTLDECPFLYTSK